MTKKLPKFIKRQKVTKIHQSDKKVTKIHQKDEKVTEIHQKAEKVTEIHLIYLSFVFTQRQYYKTFFLPH